jgi:hypothetical protein
MRTTTVIASKIIAVKAIGAYMPSFYLGGIYGYESAVIADTKITQMICWYANPYPQIAIVPN